MCKHLLASALLILVTIVFYNCTRTPCMNASLSFGLISFSDQESDTIILRRYEEGNNFSTLIDSFLLDMGFRRTNDTLDLAYTTSTGLITSQYDYELYFPGAIKLYRLSAIEEEAGEIRHSFWNNVKVGCVNKITSLTINNQVSYPPRYNYFYLSK